MNRALAIALVLAGCAKESEAAKPRPVQDACPALVDTPKAAACGNKACESGFVLVFQPKAPWPAGAYRFRLEADDRVVTCTGSLPFQGCAHRNGFCDGPDVALAESGCDLPAPSHTFWSASFQGFPRQLSVTAFHDGKPIGSAKLQPTYERSAPNGPGCGPVCCAARGELQLSF